MSLAAAALFGWAVALALGLWGEWRLHSQPYWQPWRPIALPPLNLEPTTPVVVSSQALRLLGVAGDRVYLQNGNKLLSLGVGEALPSGESIVRIERTGIVVAAGKSAKKDERSEAERRISVYGERFDPSHWDKKRSNSVSTTIARGSAQGHFTASSNQCRLSAGDRASALYLDAAVIKAIVAEGAMLAHMFDVLPDASGIRATRTGGTTAMFSIRDGDVLTRMDGVALNNADAVATQILPRLTVGQAVVVQGLRNGAPMRWVFAPRSCAT